MDYGVFDKDGDASPIEQGFSALHDAELAAEKYNEDYKASGYSPSCYAARVCDCGEGEADVCDCDESDEDFE